MHRHHRFARFAALTACAIGLVLPALAQTPGNAPAAAPVTVTLETSLGKIVLELDAQHAPQTVANFTQYVKDGYYDDTVFHRVIPGFMVQGGGYAGGLQLKPTRSPIAIESNNGLRNLRGTVAMARTSDPNSATSQFFINVADNGSLDYAGNGAEGYTVFGRVVEGIEIVDKIVNTPTVKRRVFGSDFPNLPKQSIFLTKAHLGN
jgi:cyclophilin family peptidyl-prolyl cis-trans isomerase